MDNLTKQRRSWNMSRIGSRDTSPERMVRSILHRLGYRFRLHRSDLPGKPDMVLPRYRTVVLVHGCFWHRHAGCRFACTPKSNREFWTAKFEANKVRDKQVLRQLRRLNWRVIVIWECESRSSDILSRKLERLLR
jgi:DNA mismatch endonuclease (patch repair protein)